MARPDFSSFPPVRNFDVVVALDEADPRLRSGMSASARIEMNRLHDVLVVPAAAVFQADGAPVVYVVEGGDGDAAAGHGPAARPRSGGDSSPVCARASGSRFAISATASAPVKRWLLQTRCVLVLAVAGIALAWVGSRPARAPAHSDRARAARARCTCTVHANGELRALPLAAAHRCRQSAAR